jgi:hypothetical protein
MFIEFRLKVIEVSSHRLGYYLKTGNLKKG